MIQSAFTFGFRELKKWKVVNDKIQIDNKKANVIKGMKI